MKITLAKKAEIILYLSELYVESLTLSLVYNYKKKNKPDLNYINKYLEDTKMVQREKALLALKNDFGGAATTFKVGTNKILRYVEGIPDILNNKIKSIKSSEFDDLEVLLQNLNDVDMIVFHIKGAKTIKISNSHILEIFKYRLRFQSESSKRLLKMQIPDKLPNLMQDGELKALKFIQEKYPLLTTLSIKAIRNLVSSLLPEHKENSINGITHKILELAELRPSDLSEKAKRSFIYKRCKS